MKTIANLVYVVVIFLICSCGPNTEPGSQDVVDGVDHKADSVNKVNEHRLIVPGFQSILDSNGLDGSIVIYNQQTGKWMSNDYDWAAQRRLPASTFKIVNSIIGLETNKVSDVGIQFKWKQDESRRKMWQKDFDLHGAYHASCLPCYQELARNIGRETMQQYLDKLQYGHMIIDSAGLDMFWIKGESGVNQLEQIDFLQRLYGGKLPVSQQTLAKMRRLMVIDSNENYVLSGKTGWGFQNDLDNGWFVGYIEKGQDVYFFATNVSPKESFNMKLFPKIRSAVTMEAFRETGVISE